MRSPRKSADLQNRGRHRLSSFIRVRQRPPRPPAHLAHTDLVCNDYHKNPNGDKTSHTDELVSGGRGGGCRRAGSWTCRSWASRIPSRCACAWAATSYVLPAPGRHDQGRPHQLREDHARGLRPAHR